MIFDAMGVIFKIGDDVGELLIPYIRRFNPAISSDEVINLYQKASLGRISSFEFWKNLGFESDYPRIETEYLDECLEVDEEFFTCARSLIKNFALGMLSNDVREWSGYLRAKYKLNEWLRVAVISGEVGIRKPDPGIYQELLKCIHVEPSQCLFIDDKLRNLVPAREMGFKTMLFSREGTISGAGDSPSVNSFSELMEFF